MWMRLAAIAAISLLLPVALVAQQSAVPCDRACLGNYVDRYMDAMLANDPSLELFSRDCKFTENGVRLPLGSEGLWFGMSGKGSYKFYIPDVETQQVAFIGTAQEGAANKQGEAAIVAVSIRLKIVNGLITEAEQLVKDLLAMDEPWRSRFLDLVGDLASADRPDGTQPAREEILGWLADQEICRQVHLLLIAWKG